MIAIALVLMLAGSSLAQAGVLTPPMGPIAPTGVTTQQIYDSVQTLATASGDSGVRIPGTDIAAQASMTVTC